MQSDRQTTVINNKKMSSYINLIKNKSQHFNAFNITKYILTLIKKLFNVSSFQRHNRIKMFILNLKKLNVPNYFS